MIYKGSLGTCKQVIEGIESRTGSVPRSLLRILLPARAIHVQRFAIPSVHPLNLLFCLFLPPAHSTSQASPYHLFPQMWSYNTCSSQAYGPFACWQLINTVDFLGCSGGDTSEGSTSIKVPKVYWSYTRKSILTLEWIDGIKLTDAEGISKANLNRKRMIDEVLLNCCVAVNWILVLVLFRLSSTLSLSLLWF